MQLKLFSLAAICAVFLAIPAWGHHSHGNYDITKWQTLQGTVKEFRLINPHSWVYLQVKDDAGMTKMWALETTNPIGLTRKGVTKESLKPGETIFSGARVEADGKFATQRVAVSKNGVKPPQ